MDTRSFILIILSAILLGSFSGSENLRVLEDKLARWDAVFPREKIYVHTDKPYYALGDTIWYKAYLLNGHTLEPDTLSQLLYVELLDPANKVVARHSHVIFAGGSAGQMAVPRSGWLAGNYQLRAYTRLMANTDFYDQFMRELLILDNQYVEKTTLPGNTEEDANESLDIQFLPESGYLVDGIRSFVGIKAVNGKTGLGQDIEGVVRDRNGQVVSQFRTFHLGLGQFSFLPRAGETYQAEVRQGDRTIHFPFPEAKAAGYVLQVKNRKRELYIQPMTNIPSGLEGALLVCQMKGRILAHADLVSPGPSDVISIPKDSLPAGVLQITLFTSSLRPVAERLVFVDGQVDGLDAMLVLNDEEYGPREKVVLDIRVQDSLRNVGLLSNLSLSVIDRYAVPEAKGTGNIRTYLLLSSDLRGKIERPGYYFEREDPIRKQSLDILMLTQGWRAYDWSDVLSDRPLRRRHPMERGFTIEGHISRFNQPDKPARAFVSLNVLDPLFFTEDEMTGADGRFRFTDLAFYDSTQFFIQARLPSKRSERKKDPMEGKKWNTIHLDTFRNEKIVRDTVRLRPFGSSEDLVTYFTAFEEQQQYAMSIQLEEVIIKRKRMENDPYRRTSQLYHEPDNRIILDSIPYAQNLLSPFDLIRQFVPGVQIYGSFPNETAVIRGFTSLLGSNEALFVLDGIPVDAPMISNVPITDISHIDVLKGPRASVYGSRGANGVILIYTRNGTTGGSTGFSPGIQYFIHPGPNIARRFYAPRYGEGDVLPAPGTDVRTTLHWEPFLITDTLGHARVEFYTCDRKTVYEACLQGITADGRPVVAHQTFTVQ